MCKCFASAYLSSSAKASTHADRVSGDLRARGDGPAKKALCFPVIPCTSKAPRLREKCRCIEQRIGHLHIRISAHLHINTLFKTPFAPSNPSPDICDVSETFVVSARKYRPVSWETVVGQKSITATLQNAIETNQIAQAYLFCGPRGVGKTTCARIFAREINKGAGDNADLSFNVFELDAASNNSVEDIRSITDQVRIPPQIGSYKVYIIDEVHMLSQAAFNAFLKTLEEPPPHAIFVLATTEKHKIIPTILSRCQIFDFNRIQVPDIVSQLERIAEKESVTVDAEGLHVVAQKADGAMRDALSIFDQLVAFSGKDLSYQNVIDNLNVLDYDYYFRATECILNEAIPDALVLLEEVINKGFDGHQFIIGLGTHFRNLLVCKDESTLSLMEVSDTVKARYREQAEQADLRLLVKAIDFANNCDVQYRTSKNQRLLVELTLMQMCSIKYNEAEKKKPFRIRPFSLDRDLKTKVAAPQRVIRPKVEEEQREPEPVVTIPWTKQKEQHVKPAGVGKLASVKSGLSIKSMMVTSDDSTEVDVVTEEDYGNVQEERAFSQEQFIESWMAFAERMLDEDRRSVHATLTAKIPIVGDNYRVVFELKNSVQQQEIEELKTDLVRHLRTSLHNRKLMLDIEITKEEMTNAAPYTDREKYMAMKEANPAIEYFKTRLNLDLEF